MFCSQLLRCSKKNSRGTLYLYPRSTQAKTTMAACSLDQTSCSVLPLTDDIVSTSLVSKLKPRPTSSFLASKTGVGLHFNTTNMKETLKAPLEMPTYGGDQFQFMIVGLGNHCSPVTRHSIGMRAVDSLAQKFDAKWTPQYGGFVAHSSIDDLIETQVKVVLFKPKAFMNLNGKSVGKAAKSMSILPSHIYLLHDELDIKPGNFDLKEGGSARGHKGVISCINCLQSNTMPRLRIGIGRPSTRWLVVSYVLDKFQTQELPLVTNAVDKGLERLMEHVCERIKDLT